MSRAVCGICWCPYDDDGKCGCTPQRTPSLKSAAQAALDAIERGESFAHLEEIVARSLRTALAEHPAEQEPFGEVAEVAQGYDEGWTAIIETGLRKLQKGDKVYTAPQPAKPAGQEPVAWMYFDSDGDAIFGHPNGYRPDDAVPVYTAPQPDDTALLRQALEALEFAAENVFCEQDDDLIGVARRALQERLQ